VLGYLELFCMKSEDGKANTVLLRRALISHSLVEREPFDVTSLMEIRSGTTRVTSLGSSVFYDNFGLTR